MDAIEQLTEVIIGANGFGFCIEQGEYMDSATKQMHHGICVKTTLHLRGEWHVIFIPLLDDPTRALKESFDLAQRMVANHKNPDFTGCPCSEAPAVPDAEPHAIN